MFSAIGYRKVVPCERSKMKTNRSVDEFLVILNKLSGRERVFAKEPKILKVVREYIVIVLNALCKLLTKKGETQKLTDYEAQVLKTVISDLERYKK